MNRESKLVGNVVLRHLASQDYLKPLLNILTQNQEALVFVVTITGVVWIRMFPSDPNMVDDRLDGLDAFIQGIFADAGIEVYRSGEDMQGAALSYLVSASWKHILDALQGQEYLKMPFQVLLDRRLSTYPDAKRHVIVVDSYGEAINAIKKVLLAIKNLGDVGHSTSIDIDGKTVAFVDGDGSDRIHEICVDDELLEREKTVDCAT